MDTTLSDFYDIVSPDAGAMIETLRAYGYHLETSVADIIDNSIYAEAQNVWIDCTWDGEKSTISIRDDGHGMTENALKNAMRPGSKNPLQERDAKDLGRFGLGLKTASFSQCRKLTVGSKSEENETVIRCWDLDYVNLCGEWRLVKPNKENMPPVISVLDDMNNGTIVLWEKMDRITKGTDSANKKHKDHFLAQLDIMKKHLEMVFHRFLVKPRGLKIILNGREIKPWDPFLTNHPSTQHLPQEDILYNGKKITIRPFVLPHRSKLNDEAYDLAGGPGGWNERQGFYIYRNERLIVPGDWLGLESMKGQPIRKEQFTKLARIMVDIPNSLDGDWKIDVKKSVARPPNLIKDDFQRISRLTIDKAISVFRFRGKVSERTSESSITFPWSTSVQHGNYHYSINRGHPLVSDILQNSGASRKKIQSMLRLIEETVPVPLIILNGSNNPDKIQRPFEGAPSDELKSVLEEIWSSMINTGVSRENAKLRLVHMEPFSDYPTYVTEFILKKDYEVK
jgi:hypothetical protein